MTGRPLVMFESTAPASDVPAIRDWFDAHDCDILLPNRLAHLGPPLSRAEFEDAHVHQRRVELFGVPREERVAVRDRARVLPGIVPTD